MTSYVTMVRTCALPFTRDPTAGLPGGARLAETAHRAALHPRPEAAALASGPLRARGFAGVWLPNAWLAGAFVLEKACLYDPRALPEKRETPAGALRDMNRARATRRDCGNIKIGRASGRERVGKYV